MAKPADVSSRRLVSLAPTAWVQWLTGDTQAEALELPGNEFQFASRANDVLIKVHSAEHGTYLVANEIQLRVDPRMPLRMRTYVALIEERYDLPVYPVVVNILPTTQPVASEHRGTFMGVSTLQQSRVINLWELDARAVLEGSMPTLLPFVPIMRGGGCGGTPARPATRQHLGSRAFREWATPAPGTPPAPGPFPECTAPSLPDTGGPAAALASLRCQRAVVSWFAGMPRRQKWPWRYILPST